MLIMMKVQQTGAGDGCKFAHRVEIGFALKFHCADEAANRSSVQPFLHQSQQPPRVAHDIGKQPIHCCKGRGIEGESALAEW